jgi:elongation factor P
MAQIKAGNISKGIFIIYKNTPHQVMKTEFMSPGKGSAIMRTRLKNVETGAVSDFTYKTNEMVEEAEVDKKEMQYLYKDTDDYVFMDPRTYDQVTVPGRFLKEKEGILTPQMLGIILVLDDKPIGVRLPPNVILKVTVAHDAVAGNRVNAPKKPVTLETGLEILAPLFIKAGDKVSVDTEALTYLARVN